MKLCVMAFLCLVGPVAVKADPEKASAQGTETRVFGKNASDYARELASPDRQTRELARAQLRSARTQAIPIFGELMRSEDGAVRRQCIIVFYSLTVPATEPILREALNDEDGFVRSYAYEGLRLRGPQELPVLMAYLDSIPPVRGSVARIGPLRTGEHPFGRSFDWSPDGQSLAVLEEGGALGFWSCRSWRLARTLRVDDRGLGGLRWSPDGQTLATLGTGLSSGHVYGWRVEDGRPAFILFPGVAASWSPDSRRVATVGDGFLQVYDTVKEREVVHWGIAPGVTDVAFSPDGRRIAVACEEGWIFILPETGEARRLKTSARGSRISWSADGNSLLLACDEAASVVDARSGAVLWERKASEGRCFDDLCAFAPVGDRVVLSARPRIEVAHAWTGATLRTWQDDRFYCSTPRWSPDGRYLAVHDDKSNVWVLDTLPPPSVKAAGRPDTELPEDLWERLGVTDEVAGIEAEEELVDAGQAGVGFVRSRIAPTMSLAAGEIESLARQALSGDGKGARERLAVLGQAAASVLRASSAATEGVADVRSLIDWLESVRADTRTIRALSVLVRLEKSGGKELLLQYADGARGTPLTEAARCLLLACR